VIVELPAEVSLEPLSLISTVGDGVKTNAELDAEEDVVEVFVSDGAFKYCTNIIKQTQNFIRKT